MRKKEFLLELEDKLQRIDIEEKRNIINYYDELISDKVENGQDEERVVRSLGSIDDICRKLDIETGKKSRIQYESILEEERRRNEKSPAFENHEKTTVTPKKEKSRNFASYLLILILTFPFWFPLLMTLISFIIAAFAIIFAFTVTGISLVIAGLVELGVSIPLFAINHSSALFNLGLSLVIIAFGLIITPFTIKFGGYCLKGLCRFIKSLVKLIGGKK